MTSMSFFALAAVRSRSALRDSDRMPRFRACGKRISALQFPFQRLVEESFLILGWVANWRPLEIFLYDWWPLVRRRDLYRRLSEAAVETKPYPNGQSQIPMAGPA